MRQSQDRFRIKFVTATLALKLPQQYLLQSHF